MDTDLLAALQSRERSDLATPCGYTRLKDRMSEDERTAVEAAFNKVIEDSGSGRAKVYSFTWLAGVLSDHGHSISSSTLARHARGNCGCD